MNEIKRIIAEGVQYMERIDEAVKNCYNSKDPEMPDLCKSTIAQLGLPPFLAVPVVDKAFRSHLS